MNKNILKEYSFWVIIIYTVALIISAFSIYKYRNEINSLQQEVNFNCERQGVCVYVEYDTDGWTAKNILVYDEETQKTLELDIEKSWIHDKVEVGDVIIYYVNHTYTDAHYLNFIDKT
jgi:predicted Holliday junction resolvase-like endonuclease